MRDVEKDTAFDFRKAKEIGHDIGSLDGGGYDHCFCFDNESDFRARFVENFFLDNAFLKC